MSKKPKDHFKKRVLSGRYGKWVTEDELHNASLADPQCNLHARRMLALVKQIEDTHPVYMELRKAFTRAKARFVRDVAAIGAERNKLYQQLLAEHYHRECARADLLRRLRVKKLHAIRLKLNISTKDAGCNAQIPLAMRVRLHRLKEDLKPKKLMPAVEDADAIIAAHQPPAPDPNQMGLPLDAQGETSQ